MFHKSSLRKAYNQWNDAGRIIAIRRGVRRMVQAFDIVMVWQDSEVQYFRNEGGYS